MAWRDQAQCSRLQKGPEALSSGRASLKSIIRGVYTSAGNRPEQHNVLVWRALTVSSVHVELCQFEEQLAPVDKEPERFKDRYCSTVASAAEGPFSGPEVVRRKFVRDSGYRLGVVELAAVYEAKFGCLAELVLLEELVLAQLVVLGDCSENVIFFNVTRCHADIVGAAADTRA